MFPARLATTRANGVLEKASMMKLPGTRTMRTSSTAAFAFLLASLASACGGSDSSPSSADGGGDAGHGDSSGGSSSGGSGSGGSSSGDSGNGTDGGNTATTSAVNLGGAGDFAILAMAGISNASTSAITGNMGVSPNAASSITGFALTADSSGVFSTSAQVTGEVFASDYAVPTPSNLTTAIGDMQHAFTDAAGRAPNVTELGAGNIGGRTLAPGVFKWSTGLLVPTDVTLTGSSTDVWIFQIAQNLTVSNATNIVLTGGAVPKNVFWQVAGSVDIGTTAQFQGVILTQTSIALETGASIQGRLLAQVAVTIDSSTVVQP
jgi:hypothetical protein